MPIPCLEKDNFCKAKRDYAMSTTSEASRSHRIAYIENKTLFWQSCYPFVVVQYCPSFFNEE